MQLTSQRCAACGAEVPLTFRFCGQCGQSLTAEEPEAPPTDQTPEEEPLFVSTSGRSYQVSDRAPTTNGHRTRPVYYPEDFIEEDSQTGTPRRSKTNPLPLAVLLEQIEYTQPEATNTGTGEGAPLPGPATKEPEWVNRVMTDLQEDGWPQGERHTWRWRTLVAVFLIVLLILVMTGVSIVLHRHHAAKPGAFQPLTAQITTASTPPAPGWVAEVAG